MSFSTDFHKNWIINVGDIQDFRNMRFFASCSAPIRVLEYEIWWFHVIRHAKMSSCTNFHENRTNNVGVINFYLKSPFERKYINEWVSRSPMLFWAFVYIKVWKKNRKKCVSIKRFISKNSPCIGWVFKNNLMVQIYRNLPRRTNILKISPGRSFRPPRSRWRCRRCLKFLGIHLPAISEFPGCSSLFFAV